MKEEEILFHVVHSFFKVFIIIILLYIALRVSITPKIESSDNKKVPKIIINTVGERNTDNFRTESINDIVSDSDKPANISRCGIPINIPTRGQCSNFKQLGVLTSNDNSTILPLYGKKLWNGSCKSIYYTQNSNFVSVRLPVYLNGKDCSGEYGCEELSDNDEVTVPQMNMSFKVTLYHLDTPRYIPYVC